MSTALDPFFTPAQVAGCLAAHIADVAPSLVLDPAAGDGALLSAGEARWPGARIVALDCDPQRVRGLRKHSNWTAGRCDLLSERSRQSSPIWRDIQKCVDVVLLNPPFTARGNSRWHSSLDGIDVTSGRAMAFVLTALSVVKEGGEMMALLPSSTVTSQRDAQAWETLRKFADVKVVERFPRGTFREGTASTVGVHLRKSPNSRGGARHTTKKRSHPSYAVELVRGAIPVHTAKSLGLSLKQAGHCRLPFLHTTDLQAGEVVNRLRTITSTPSATCGLGPAVLLPRVGKPLREKIAIWHGGRFILSDCLFAIGTSHIDVAGAIRSLLHERFDAVADAYGGACAPYLTIASLVEVLNDLGVATRWQGPARWVTQAPRWSELRCN